jgi:hypothetical protein
MDYMAVDVVWHKPEANILRYIFADNWTLAELEQAIYLNASMIQTPTPPPTYILDFRASGIVPLGWMVARPRLMGILPIRRRVMVVVGMNGLIRVFLQFYMRYDPDFLVYFAASMEAADEILADLAASPIR